MANQKSRIDLFEDGTIYVRTEMPKDLWIVIQKFARRNRLSDIQGLWMMLNRISSLISRGEYSFLGPEFESSIQEAVINDELPKHGLPPLADYIGRLHRSSKNKSGFFGVYANGNGYRALGALPGGRSPTAKNLGTYPTAEEAAYRRYLYYKQHHLPYGPMEEEVYKEMDALGSQATVQDALENINHSRAAGGQELYRLDDDDETQFRKTNDRRPAVPLGLSGDAVKVFDELDEK